MQRWNQLLAAGVLSASAVTSPAQPPKQGLADFVPPAPQDAVLIVPSFQKAMENILSAVERHVAPSPQDMEAAIQTARNEITRQQKGRRPMPGQTVMLANASDDLAFIIDPHLQTLAVLRMKQDKKAADATPVLTYAMDKSLSQETIAKAAKKALEVPVTPSLGMGLQPRGR